MTIKFILRDSAGKDGLHKVRCYIYHNGKAQYNTKYSVKSSQWDEKHGRFKESNPNAFSYNSKLIELRNELERLCIKYEHLNATEITKLIGKNGSIASLKTFWENFLKECNNGTRKLSPSTIKKYTEALGSIGKFDEKYIRRSDFSSINMEWYTSYTGYLRSIRKVNETTVGNHIKLIKSIMRMAYDAGVSTNEEFRKKYFKKTVANTDHIYLTEKEIQMWENVDLSNYPYLQAEKDRFLLSYYFLLRFGDSLKIGKENILNEGKKLFYKNVSEKTNAESIIPINKKALILLKKYDYKLPITTNQEANWKLKEIGGLALITNVVKLNGESKQKKYFIHTHTARRSAATHLYLQGLPIKDLSHLLGHSKVAQTEEYIKVSKLESAKKALDFDFFK